VKSYLLYFLAVCICSAAGLALPKLFPYDPPPPVRTLSLLDTETNQVREIPLEDYVVGVMEAAAYPQTGEALKAIAIAVRSRSVYCQENTPRHKNAAVCNNPDCCAPFQTENFSQAYIAAAAETAGMILTYQGKAAAATTHPSSGKFTSSSENAFGIAIPYLTGVRNVEENRMVEKVYTAEQFLSRLGFHADTPWDELLFACDRSGRVQQVEWKEHTLSGTSAAARLELPSLCFECVYSHGTVLVTCYGEGHGVGMSLNGASILAAEGKGCGEILLFYYPGTQLTSIE
jgi:stage II sporulation protein D